MTIRMAVTRSAIAGLLILMVVRPGGITWGARLLRKRLSERTA